MPHSEHKRQLHLGQRVARLRSKRVQDTFLVSSSRCSRAAVGGHGRAVKVLRRCLRVDTTRRTATTASPTASFLCHALVYRRHLVLHRLV